MTGFVGVRALGIALGSFVAVYVGLSLATGGTSVLLGDLAQLAPPVMFAWMCLALAARRSGGVRVFWNLNALHGLVWAVAQAIRTSLELAHQRGANGTSLADPIFFAAGMPLAAALYGRPDRERPRWLFNVVVLDIVLIALFFAFIYLYLITALALTGHPEFYAPTPAHLSNAIGVILAACAAWVWLTAKPPAWRRTLRLYFVALLSLAVGSAVVSWAVDRGIYRTGGLYDLGWIIPYSILALVPAYSVHVAAELPEVGDLDERRPSIVSATAVALLVGIPLTDRLARAFAPSSHEIADVRTQLTLTMVIPFGVVVLARELLWRHALTRARADLDTARSQLAKTEKLAAVGQLMSGMAHELNNPLQGVLGHAELMLATRDDEPTREDLRRIRNDATRAAGIVRNLLAFADTDRTLRSWQDVNQLVQRAIESRRYHLNLARVHLIVNKTERLPFVYVDAAQLEKVFVNLLVNAEHAIRAVRAPQIRVTTRFDASREQIVVDVADNGPGIEPNDLPRVFDPFFTTGEAGEETGLALSYCYGVVHEHGGDLMVENLEPGARFVVQLPVRAAGAAPGEPPHDREAPEGCRALVVDDDEANAALVRRALEKRGYEVESTTLSRRALVMIERSNFDVVIADVKMPELSGSELYARACALKPAIASRFIFVTGDAHDPDTRRFLEECGCTYFVKPFELDRLAAAIGSLVHGPAVKGG